MLIKAVKLDKLQEAINSIRYSKMDREAGGARSMHFGYHLTPCAEQVSGIGSTAGTTGMARIETLVNYVRTTCAMSYTTQQMFQKN